MRDFRFLPRSSQELRWGNYAASSGNYHCSLRNYLEEVFTGFIFRRKKIVIRGMMNS
jgi:hypothetical protein